MELTERVLKTSVKAGLLSSVLFTIAMGIFNMDIRFEDIFYFLLISFIVAIIICGIFIIVSILPIMLLDKQRSRREQFRRYFPYYTMLFFIGITVLSIMEKFEEFVTIFLLIAYVTAAQTWIWLFKDNKAWDLTLDFS